MKRKRVQLTDREWKWLWEYTRTGGNASQAARIAYGGTPISVRVKGHKKKQNMLRIAPTNPYANLTFKVNDYG